MSELESLNLPMQWEQFLRVLRTRMHTILIFTGVTFFVVVVGTALQKRLYRGSATVLIDMETPNLLSVSTSRDEATVGENNYLAYADYYQTQVEIITSRAVAKRVFENLRLGEHKRYKRAKDPLEVLLKQIKVKPVKLTRLAKINVLDPNPEQAARIANEFAMIFVEENLDKTTADESLTLMKNEYLKLQSKEAELSKRYKTRFPAMVRLRQQMSQLAQALEEETKRQLHYERHLAEGNDLASKASTKTLVERIHESSLVGGLKPNNIRVIDFSEVPKKLARPNVKLNLVLALILGLLGSSAMAIAQDLLDSSLKNPEDIEQDGRFTLLGYVPQIEGLSEQSGISLRERYQYSMIQPHSQAAEAYRTLRTSLLYSAPQEKAQAVVMTSPGTGEGKTTTSSNLAISLTQLGLKVLLVDADLRRPRLHEAFQLEQSPGLSEFLVGRATFENVTRPTEVPGLWVVTSGACPPNPAELLAAPLMSAFLKKACEKFERVLLDSPPVIPVADAAILAGMTGAVIAVAQSWKTPRQALDRLNDVCRKAQTKLLGVILNNVPGRASSTYYGYSSYGYGYGGYGKGFSEGNNGKAPASHIKSASKKKNENRRPTVHEKE